MAGNKVTKQVTVVSGASPSANLQNEDAAFFSASGKAVMPGFVPMTTATAIGTAAKAVTDAEPAAGTCIALTFTNGNSAASPTVAFNGGTARAIQLGGAASAAIEITIAAGGIGFFMFDGTVLHQFGVYS
jgi:hypothetical protein